MMQNCVGPNCPNPATTGNIPQGTGAPTTTNVGFNPINPIASINPINPVTSIVPPYPNQNEYTEIDNLPFYNRTNYLQNVPGTTNVPIGTGAGAATNISQPSNAAMAGMPAGQMPSQDEVFQEAPLFPVPSNPLLPPGYQNILDYGNLQYMNGFLRTQIGKYVRIQQLVGSNVIEDRYGYLVGVGINYILLQEISTGNILVLDFYNIKFVYLYYTKTDLPQNEVR